MAPAGRVFFSEYAAMVSHYSHSIITCAYHLFVLCIPFLTCTCILDFFFYFAIYAQ